MPAKRYIVSLTNDERQTLEQLTKTGKAAASKINHARLLLKADINHQDGSWTDQAISDAFNISTRTIERVRQRFVEESWENALTPRPRHERETTTLRRRSRSTFDSDHEVARVRDRLLSSTDRL